MKESLLSGTGLMKRILLK